MPRHIRPSDTSSSHPPVSPFFQPIADLRQGTIFGHEALIRGPVGTPLHSPLELLALAARESRLTEFELHCVEVILAHWGQLNEPGRLFTRWARALRSTTSAKAIRTCGAGKTCSPTS